MSTPRKRRRTLFDYVPGQHRPNRVLGGTAFVVGILIFCWVIYTKPRVPLISTSGFSVHGYVNNGVNLDPGQTPVEVHGVVVGVVTGVKKAPNGINGAEVTFQVNHGTHVSVREDASFNVEWRTVLGGNVFIDLDPGSASAPPLDSAVIPLSRTSTQVELDQVLQPFNAAGRNGLQTMIVQFDKAFSGKALAGLSENLAPAMRNLAPALQAIRGTQPGDLTNVITSTSQVAAEAAKDEVALGNLIDNGAVALGVTAARSADLASTVNTAPGAELQTQATMLRLRTTLSDLNPLAQSLVPGARALLPTDIAATRSSILAQPVFRDLIPLSQTLKPAAQSLAVVGRNGVPAVTSLNTTVQRAASNIIPWLQSTDPDDNLKVFEEVGPTVAAANSGLSIGDKDAVLADFGAGAGGNALQIGAGGPGVGSPNGFGVRQIMEDEANYALAHPNATPSDTITAVSPCSDSQYLSLTKLPGGSIACELLFRTLTSVLLHVPVSKIAVPNSTVSASELLPYLGKTLQAVIK
ncbi:MAG TPA: MlaD family protein [Solirubrobacteraceae bacterium]|jgi:virulence factor Mce-like protein|nr:MlaD family protein [Solirubrobacteraceae bacterium]